MLDYVIKKKVEILLLVVKSVQVYRKLTEVKLFM